MSIQVKMASIEDLPHAALVKILDYLMPNQKRNLLLVNRFFYNFVAEYLDRSLWIKFNTASLVSHTKEIPISFVSIRQFHFLTIQQVSTNLNTVMKSARKIENISIGAEYETLICDGNLLVLFFLIFTRFGRNFKNLELIGICISFPELKTLLNHCPNWP